ncbi:MAG: hypothetical protein J0M12_02530 [Deltaproteobacteria bacterium]|nr:hypothetical protein [Deltaproteobacteria bacterium]
MSTIGTWFWNPFKMPQALGSSAEFHHPIASYTVLVRQLRSGFLRLVGPTLGLALTTLFSSQVLAQTAAPATSESKGLRSATLGQTNSTYDFNLGSTFDRILTETASTELYDPFTINNLKRMQAEAQPDWDPAGIDPDRTRTVAERAFSIQAGRSMINTLKNSDVRQTYYDVVGTFSSVQEAFRFSVRNDGSSLSVGKKGTGQKLIEFNVEFNLRQGLDPQLRIGRSGKLHYDTNLNAPMLEYGFAF